MGAGLTQEPIAWLVSWGNFNTTMIHSQIYKNTHIATAYRFFSQEFFKPDYISKHFSQWRRNYLKEDLDKFMKEIYVHFYL